MAGFTGPAILGLLIYHINNIPITSTNPANNEVRAPELAEMLGRWSVFS